MCLHGRPHCEVNSFLHSAKASPAGLWRQAAYASRYCFHIHSSALEEIVCGDRDRLRAGLGDRQLGLCDGLGDPTGGSGLTVRLRT